MWNSLHVCSVYFEGGFFLVWAILAWRFWDRLLVSVPILIFFYCFRYFINYWKYWFPYSHAPTFMCTLSIKVRNWCTPWPYAQFLTRMLSLHISFPIFQMFILHSIRICVRTDACTEHTHQELLLHWTQSLQNMLSICIRDWCVPWAYRSGTYAFAKHTLQELMRTLRIHISFLLVCSA